MFRLTLSRINTAFATIDHNFQASPLLVASMYSAVILLYLLALIGIHDAKSVKEDYEVISTMRNALRKMSLEDLAETAGSKQKHEESKTVMPGVFQGHDTECWEKCKPGEKSTKPALIKETQSADETPGQRRSISSNVERGTGEQRKKDKTSVKLIFSPGESHRGGWIFTAKLLPIEGDTSQNP